MYILIFLWILTQHLWPLFLQPYQLRSLHEASLFIFNNHNRSLLRPGSKRNLYDMVAAASMLSSTRDHHLPRSSGRPPKLDELAELLSSCVFISWCWKLSCLSHPVSKCKRRDCSCPLWYSVTGDRGDWGVLQRMNSCFHLSVRKQIECYQG